MVVSYFYMNRALLDCVPFLLGMLACAAVAWRIRVSGSTFGDWIQLTRLHSDEQGAVQSLSFVLTLPVFVMLMLFIVQLSQVTIARMVVEYAAYAAARSAIVWIPADLGGLETPNRVGPRRQDLGTTRDENGHEFARYLLVHPSRKLQRIEHAAAQALLPVCPSRDVGADPAQSGMLALPTLERAYQVVDPTSTSNARIPNRLRNKLAYALAATSVEIEVRHKDTEPPLTWHDLAPYRNEFEENEIGWQDQLLVTVRHDFALLPGPARFLAKRRIAPGKNSDDVADRISQRANVFVYPLTATVRLSNEGEKGVLSYLMTNPP
jgi:hypothetical protein